MINDDIAYKDATYYCYFIIIIIIIIIHIINIVIITIIIIIIVIIIIISRDVVTSWIQRRLATPTVNRQTRAPWRDSEDQAGDDFEDRLVSRGGGDARRGIPARRALWRRGDVVQRDDIWWFLGGYQAHAIDFHQYQDSETRRSSYPRLYLDTFPQTCPVIVG